MPNYSQQFPDSESKVLTLKNANIVNVYSGEVIEGDVVVEGERIRRVGKGLEATGGKTMDLKGKFLVPGYIDPHFHPWFVYNPISIGEFAASRGVTTLFCDNLIFYMLMGHESFKRFMGFMSRMPVKFFWFCRAVPQTPMENEEKLFSVENIKDLISNPLIRSLGEITRWPHVLRRNPKIMELIEYTKASGKRVDGHTAGAKPHEVEELSRLGISSCHEAINPEEALVRLRAGMYIILRESSLRRDLKDLLEVVKRHRVFTDRIMLTTDCSSPSYYVEKGFLDHPIKICIDKGIDPVVCYRMVTLNPAVYFGMDLELGGIAPGRYADMVVLEDLKNPEPIITISKGKIVSENGSLKATFIKPEWESFFPPESGFGNPERVNADIFRTVEERKPKKAKLPVMKLVSNVITKLSWMEFRLNEGFPDISQYPQISYLSLIERKVRWVSNGLIAGFSNVDAISSSFNTATQIVSVGRNPRAMEIATRRVMEMGGGIVVISGGKLIFELYLPVGGVMSEKSVKDLSQKDMELKRILKEAGYRFHDPFYTLVFLPCDFLPEVRINYRGFENIKTGEVLLPRRDLK